MIPYNYILALFFSTASALFLGFFGEYFGPLDSLSHFRAYFSIVLVCISLLFLLRRKLTFAIGGVGLAALSLATVVPSYTSTEARAVSSEPVFTVLHLNVLAENSTIDAVVATIRDVRPDVVLLNELSDVWDQDIASLADEYPFRLVCPRTRYPDGVAILSRHDWSPDGIQPHCAEGERFAVVSVDWRGASIQLATVHLIWPWPYDRAAQLRRLIPELSSIGGRGIMTGDMNSVPWSAAVRQLEAMTGLSVVRGQGPTWLPIWLPAGLRPFGLPIDQVFVNGLSVQDIKILGAVGSDHFPVLVSLSLPTN